MMDSSHNTTGLQLNDTSVPHIEASLDDSRLSPEKEAGPEANRTKKKKKKRAKKNTDCASEHMVDQSMDTAQMTPHN